MADNVILLTPPGVSLYAVEFEHLHRGISLEKCVDPADNSPWVCLRLSDQRNGHFARGQITLSEIDALTTALREMRAHLTGARNA